MPGVAYDKDDSLIGIAYRQLLINCQSISMVAASAPEAPLSHIVNRRRNGFAGGLAFMCYAAPLLRLAGTS